MHVHSTTCARHVHCQYAEVISFLWDLLYIILNNLFKSVLIILLIIVEKYCWLYQCYYFIILLIWKLINIAGPLFEFPQDLGLRIIWLHISFLHNWCENSSKLQTWTQKHFKFTKTKNFWTQIYPKMYGITDLFISDVSMIFIRGGTFFFNSPAVFFN